MAVTINTKSPHGVEAVMYWRLNSFDQAPNRQPDGTMSVPAIARFRAFLSKADFQAGKHFLAEKLVTFTPAYDGDVREEAYTALKALAEFAGAADVLDD